MDNIVIYVRLPKNKDKNRRIVSFRMAERIPQDLVLALGGAIDGGQALFEIDDPLKKNALLNLERNIVLMLKAHQYTPTFG